MVPIALTYRVDEAANPDPGAHRRGRWQRVYAGWLHRSILCLVLLDSWMTFQDWHAKSRWCDWWAFDRRNRDAVYTYRNAYASSDDQSIAIPPAITR